MRAGRPRELRDAIGVCSAWSCGLSELLGPGIAVLVAMREHNARALGVWARLAGRPAARLARCLTRLGEVDDVDMVGDWGNDEAPC